MPLHTVISHNLFPHAATQATILGTVVATPSPWAALGAAVLGALATWILQETSKGLWRQIASLQSQVADLAALRCPFGPDHAAACQVSGPPPVPPAPPPSDGRRIEL